jgi:hypothetical protein
VKVIRKRNFMRMPNTIAVSGSAGNAHNACTGGMPLFSVWARQHHALQSCSKAAHTVGGPGISQCGAVKAIQQFGPKTHGAQRRTAVGGTNAQGAAQDSNRYTELSQKGGAMGNAVQQWSQRDAAQRKATQSGTKCSIAHFEVYVARCNAVPASAGQGR